MVIILLLIFRWLIAVGREEEAKNIVTKYAKSNKSTFADGEWDIMISTEKRKVFD